METETHWDTTRETGITTGTNNQGTELETLLTNSEVRGNNKILKEATL